MSREYKLSEMVDLALATPKIGVINCFMLHSLLHALIKRLKLGECAATIQVKGDENIPFTEIPTRTNSALKSVPKISVVDDVIINVSHADVQKSKEVLTVDIEKKLSRSDSKRLDRDGVDAKVSQSLSRESSATRKKERSNLPVPGVSSGEESHGSQGESSGGRRGSHSQRRKSMSPMRSTTITDQTGQSSRTGLGSTKSAHKEAKDSQGPVLEDGIQRAISQSLDKDIDSSYDPDDTSSASGFGIPYIENGVHLLVDNLRHVPDLVKDLQQKLTDTENTIIELKADNQGKIEVLKDTVLTVLDKMGIGSDKVKLASIFGQQGNYEDLTQKMDQMVEMSNDLEHQVHDKIHSDSDTKKLKTKKESKSSKPPKKGKERKSSASDLESSEGSDKEKTSKADRRGSLERDAGKRDAVGRETQKQDATTEAVKSKRKKTKVKDDTIPQIVTQDAQDAQDTTGQAAAGPSTEVRDVKEQGLAPETDVESASEGVVSDGEKLKAKEAQDKKGEAGIAPVKKRPMLLRSKTSLSPTTNIEIDPKGREGIETLQKKINMVLRLMSKVEKAMHNIPEIGKDLSAFATHVDEDTDASKVEGSKVDLIEAPKHKDTQAHYQLLNNRLKKVEDDLQRLFTLISSDSNSSSHLTKMVGDFLNTLSKTSSTHQAVPETKPKKARKERAKREDVKDEEVVEAREGSLEKEMSGDEGEGIGEEEQEKEGVEKEGVEKEGVEKEGVRNEGVGNEGVENEETEKKEEGKTTKEQIDDETRAKEMEMIQDVPILKDFEPEKLSDMWDQLKVLAEAFRCIKCNVVSLEKNSKNMAKALHTLMKGNTNIVDEDFEIIGEMKMVVRKILSDVRNIDIMVNVDRETLDTLKGTSENLLQDFDETKTLWSEKMENLRLDMITKAEKHDLDNMVSSVQKKVNLSDYRREIDKLKTESQEKEANFMMDIQTLKNDKYDRFEMDIFRMWVECKLNATKRSPMSEMKLSGYEEDGAVLKKKIPYHCLSCDKSLMITPQTRLPNVDHEGLPLSKRTRPMSANELDPSRLLKKRDKVLLEGKDNKLYKGDQELIMEKENNTKSSQEEKKKESNTKTSEEETTVCMQTLSKRNAGIPENLVKDKSMLSERNIVIDQTSLEEN